MRTWSSKATLTAIASRARPIAVFASSQRVSSSAWVGGFGGGASSAVASSRDVQHRCGPHAAPDVRVVRRNASSLIHEHVPEYLLLQSFPVYTPGWLAGLAQRCYGDSAHHPRERAQAPRGLHSRRSSPTRPAHAPTSSSVSRHHTRSVFDRHSIPLKDLMRRAQRQQTEYLEAQRQAAEAEQHAVAPVTPIQQAR